MSKNNNTKTKRHKCKDINPLLVDYASGQHLPADIQRIEEHLSTCRNCREEYTLIQQLNRETHRLDEACNAVMASIDWEDTAYTITGNIPFEEAPRKSKKPWFDFNLSRISFSWKLAVPAMTGIFLLGIWLGYLIFHVTPTGPAGPAVTSTQKEVLSLDRLENTLARKEVVSYFDQTQLVLTDLMKQCSTDESLSLQNQVDIRRVRTLLGKSRYFKENLNNPQLLSSKPLLKKIEWLLYEILMNDIEEDTSCKRLQQLQNYIKQERLLFKIRLVGKELKLSEV
jgi:hypothetical protein